MKTRQRSSGYVQNLGPVLEYKAIKNITMVTDYINSLDDEERIYLKNIKEISGMSSGIAKYLLITLSNQNMITRGSTGFIGERKVHFYKKKQLTENEVLEASQYRPK